MLVVKIIRWSACIAFYLVYGVWTLVSGFPHLIGRLRVTRRLLRDSLPCQVCNRTEVSTLGRWTCATCSSVYAGSAVACPYCGAHASHYSCVCGASIPLEPWR